MPSNLTPSTATYLSVINADYTITTQSNVGYGRSALGDIAGWPTMYRHAWYRYVPNSDGGCYYNLDECIAPAGGYVQMWVLQLESDNTLTSVSTATGGGVKIIGLQGGRTYFLVYESSVDGDGTYVVKVGGPNNVSPDPGNAFVGPTNHQYANAITIVPDSGGGWAYAQDNTPADFATAETHPSGIGLGGTRAGYFKIVAQRTGLMGLQASASDSVEIDLFSYDGTNFSLLSYAYNSTTPSIDYTVTAGVTYYLRVANGNSAQVINLSAYGLTVDNSNHQAANAAQILPDSSGVWTSTLSTTSAHFQEPENAVGVNVNGKRAAWYTFMVATNAQASLRATPASYDIEMDLFETTDGNTTSMQFDTAVSVAAGQLGTVTWNFVTGRHYFFRVATTTTVSGRFPAQSIQLSSLALPQASASAPDPSTDHTQHQYANAVQIVGNTQGTYIFTADSSGFWSGGEAIPPGSFSSSGLGGYRAAWWVYRPQVNGTWTVTAQGGSYSVDVQLYHSTSGGFQQVTEFSGSGQLTYSTGVSAGQTYYLRIADSYDSSGQYFYLNGTVPGGSTGIVAVQVPPVAVHVAVHARGSQPGVHSTGFRLRARIRGRITGAVDVVEWVPIAVHVAVQTREVGVTTVPPIRAHAVVGPVLRVEAGLYLTQPDDLEVVATATPEFIVALDQHDDTLTYTIEVQYDEDPLFTSPVTISADIDPSAGGLDVVATSPITASTAYWRARLLLDGVQQIGWTATNTFTIDSSITAQSLPVTWAVNESTAREIHLWHFDPPGPQVGDLVTAYGQGFPFTGTLTFADQQVPVESWTLVPQSAASSTDARVIDGDVVDPEHYEVTFYAPEVDDDTGGAFVVEA